MLATGPSPSGVAAQVRHLTDIYHSLGASRVSGIVSTLSAAIMAGVIFNWSRWGALLSFIAVMAGVLAFFYIVLSTNRRSARSRLINETSTALHVHLNTPPAIIQMPTGAPTVGQRANV